MLLITTSHRPSTKTRRFCNSLKILPNSYRKNRGSSSLKDLLEKSLIDGFSRIILVNTRYGNPSELLFYKNKEQISFKFVILGVKMREQTIKKNNIQKFSKVSIVNEDSSDTEIIENIRRFLNKRQRKFSKAETKLKELSLIIKFRMVETETIIEFLNSENNEVLLPTIRGFFKVI